MLNLERGLVLLGVGDDEKVSGLTREPSRVGERVMQLARDCVQPPVIPYRDPMESLIAGPDTGRGLGSRFRRCAGAIDPPR